MGGEVKIEIVIPSMGRAERVLTKNAISHAKICVPESESRLYAEYNPELEIVTHPDSLKGLTLKRQFIHEKYPNVFMIDDDIDCISRLYVEKGENSKLDIDEAYDVVQYIGNCAKLAGAYLFGISKEVNPLSYNDHKPIELTGVLNGDIGMLEGSKLFFHELAKVSEDYWISAYNAYLYRYCWIDKRFAAKGKATFGNTGGCANIRTKEQEKEDTLFLRKMFGECIGMKEDTKLAKRKHEFMRTLKIPF